MLPMKVAFQVTRGATAAPALGHSAMLAPTVTGGALLSLQQQVLGTATCTITTAMQTGTTPISKMVFLCVASGIRGFYLFDSLTI